MKIEEEIVFFQKIIGARTPSNMFWALILLFGGGGFLITGLASFMGYNLRFLGEAEWKIVFLPQGLVMSFYGFSGLFISFYLWLTIVFNVGSGYNEFDCQKGTISLFRWSFPGKNRKIRLRCYVSDIEAVCINSTIGFTIKPTISLRIQGTKNLTLNSPIESVNDQYLETEAARLAQLFQVPLEKY